MGNSTPTRSSSLAIWGPYPNYDDIAKLEYGRILWKSRTGRARLVSHWTNSDHPQREHFEENRPVLEEILEAEISDSELDQALRLKASSLRAAARDIPSVFGSIPF